MEKLTEQEMLNQPKEQVMERQFKHNCDYGYKQPKVNVFIKMAFESGFENGVNYQRYSETADGCVFQVTKELIKAAEYALLELQIIPCKCDQKAIEMLDNALKNIKK